MSSKQEPLILDYNNMHSLFTLPCYKFSNSKLLVYTEFNTIVTSFADYVRFVIDQLHSSTQYDMTFFSNDSALYEAARDIEPILSTLEKAVPHITNLNISNEIKTRLECYLDNISKNINLGYKVVDLYYDYLISMAQLQVIYCFIILKKNKKASSSSSARPFKIIPHSGNILNSLNEDKGLTDIQFITEIRNAPQLKKTIPLTVLEEYHYGDFIKEAIKVTIPQQDGIKVVTPDVLAYIQNAITTLPNNVRTNIEDILNTACYITVIAEAVKRDRVIYSLDDSGLV